MPSTLNLIFYIGLTMGALMIVSSIYVYVRTHTATWGTLAFAGMACILISIGVIANLSIEWSEKGGHLQLATTEALTEGIKSNTEFQQEQAKINADIQDQLASLTKQYEGIRHALEVSKNTSQPLELPTTSACSPSASALGERRLELLTKQAALQARMLALGKAEKPNWQNQDWTSDTTDYKFAYDKASDAQMAAVQGQLDQVAQALEMVDAMRALCELSKAGAKLPQ